jgi:hypothetical protein
MTISDAGGKQVKPTGYSPPRIIESRVLHSEHTSELLQSSIDLVTAGLAGVFSVDHEQAYDMGLRNGTSDLEGLCFRYWEPQRQGFSPRFVRVKPDVRTEARKYLQPVGEKPRFYFVVGTSAQDLADITMPVFLTEGEKKALSLDRASRESGIRALIIGLGGVWSWRHSPREQQPDGSLGKGRSRAIVDFNLITWIGRKVYIFFDSDVVANWRVQAAETALAKELAQRHAEVYIVRIPQVMRG